MAKTNKAPAKSVATPKNLITPMSPTQAKKETEALDHMYEKMNSRFVSSDTYDKALVRIQKALTLWVEAKNGR